MHYFWFVPVLALVLMGVAVLYFVLARRLPDDSGRSVEGALALEQEEDSAAAARVHPPA